MSYTTNRQPQGKIYLWTNKLREAMIAELIAINDYSHAINICDNDEIKDLLYHIMEDEKRHYGMFLEMLREYDTVQYEKYKEAKEHVNIVGNNKHLKQHAGKQDMNSMLRILRENIKGELEAIILYEQHLIEIECEKARKIIFDIIGDEKEHTEELTLALLKYDKDNYGPIDKEKNDTNNSQDKH